MKSQITIKTYCTVQTDSRALEALSTIKALLH